MAVKQGSKTIAVDYTVEEEADSANKIVVYMSFKDSQGRRLVVDGSFGLLLDALKMLGQPINLINSPQVEE